MGRLSDIKQETSPFVNKEVLATKRTVFTIKDIDNIMPRDENENGYWKVTILLSDGSEKFFSLGHGRRDIFMLGLTDEIAAMGPIENCILTQRQAGMYKVYDIEEA